MLFRLFPSSHQLLSPDKIPWQPLSVRAELKGFFLDQYQEKHLEGLFFFSFLSTSAKSPAGCFLSGCAGCLSTKLIIFFQNTFNYRIKQLDLWPCAVIPLNITWIRVWTQTRAHSCQSVRVYISILFHALHVMDGLGRSASASRARRVQCHCSS